MCVGPFKPDKPDYPDPPETPPKAEDTARAPVIGDKRDERGRRRTGSKRKTMLGKSRGTGDLRIPQTLITDHRDLRY